MAVGWIHLVDRIIDMGRVPRQAPADPEAVGHRVSWLESAVLPVVVNTLLDCGVDVTDRDVDGVRAVIADLAEAVRGMIDAGLVEVRRRQLVTLAGQIGNAEAELAALRARRDELEKLVTVAPAAPGSEEQA